MIQDLWKLKFGEKTQVKIKEETDEEMKVKQQLFDFIKKNS